MNIEIDQEDIKEKSKYDASKGIAFNIIKYGVASLPIIVPFIVLMYITNYDILISIAGTALFVIMLYIFFIFLILYYADKNGGDLN